MDEYDCTHDIERHRAGVLQRLYIVMLILQQRAIHHDDSKLIEPEKSLYDHWNPTLSIVAHGTKEYEQVITEMLPGLLHHYSENRHHVEHYEHGIDDMNLIDLIEMTCDWMAASARTGKLPDLNYLSKKYSISPQLAHILSNTISEIDRIKNEDIDA